MTSLLTNLSAMSALSTLAATRRSLQAAQAQASSGLRVATASDDAAYWSISTAMKSQLAALSAVNDGLALTKSIADVTASALSSIISIVGDIQEDVVSAAQSGIDASVVQQEIADRRSQIISIAGSASFDGVDWLYGSEPFKITGNLSVTETDDTDEAEYRTPGNSYDTRDALDDQVQIVDPDGVTQRYDYDQPTEHWLTNVNQDGDRIAVDLVRSPPTITSSVSAQPIAGFDLPSSYSSNGPVDSLIPSVGFSIFDNTDVTVDRSFTDIYNDKTDESVDDDDHDSLSDVQDEVVWSDENNPVANFLAATLPGSPLSSLNSVDVTSRSSAENQKLVSSTLSSLTAIASRVGSLQNQLSTQRTFNSALSDAIAAGIGSLEDADMNLASTRLQALQTQQRLGIQSLSIANQNGQLVLKLFGGA